jgi:hypothetical protein
VEEPTNAFGKAKVAPADCQVRLSRSLDDRGEIALSGTTIFRLRLLGTLRTFLLRLFEALETLAPPLPSLLKTLMTRLALLLVARDGELLLHCT